MEKDLVSKFMKQKRRLMRIRRQSPTWQKEKERKIIAFLSWVDERFGVRDLSELKQEYYRTYIDYLSRMGKSPETQRKHALAIKELVERSHLDIRIQPSKAKRRKTMNMAGKIIRLLGEEKIEVPDKKGLKQKIASIVEGKR